MAKIAAEELIASDQAGIGGEHHVRQTGLRLDRFNSTTKRPQSVTQPLPLPCRQFLVCLAGAVHPRINFVFDSVAVRRTKEQMAHAQFRIATEARGIPS